MLLKDIPHVICYIDDVLVIGLMEEEHLQNSTQVCISQTTRAKSLTQKREMCFTPKRRSAISWMLVVYI